MKTAFSTSVKCVVALASASFLINAGSALLSRAHQEPGAKQATGWNNAYAGNLTKVPVKSHEVDVRNATMCWGQSASTSTSTSTVTSTSTSTSTVTTTSTSTWCEGCHDTWSDAMF